MYNFLFYNNSTIQKNALEVLTNGVWKILFIKNEFWEEYTLLYIMLVFTISY